MTKQQVAELRQVHELLTKAKALMDAGGFVDEGDELEGAVFDLIDVIDGIEQVLRDCPPPR